MSLFTDFFTKTHSSINMAINVNDIEKVKELLAEGKSPNVKDNRGWVAIHFAVDYGNLSIILLLLEHDDVSANAETYESETPLLLTLCKKEFSVDHNDCNRLKYDIVKLLLQFGADPNSNSKYPFMTPLSKAVSLDFPQLVELLLKHGACINEGDDHFVSPFHVAVGLRYHGLDILDLLFASEQFKANEKMFITKPHTPLHSILAAQVYLNIAMLKRFLSVPGVSSVINETDDDGYTALALACKRTSVDAIELLLDYGADPNIRSNRNEIPFILLLKSCSRHPNPAALRTADRLLSITCLSEIKKSKFIDQMFYEYLIITKKISLLKSALQWYPCLKEITCSSNELLTLYFQDIDKYRRYSRITKERPVSLLGTASLACTDEKGLAIFEIILELGCSIQGNVTVPPIALAFFDQTSNSENYTIKIIQTLIDLGAEPAFIILDSYEAPAFLLSIEYPLSLKILEILMREIDEKMLFDNFWNFHRNGVLPSSCLCSREEPPSADIFFKTILCFEKYFSKFPCRFLTIMNTNYGHHSEEFKEWMNITKTPRLLTSLCRLKIHEILYHNKTETTSIFRLTNKLCDDLKLPPCIRDILCFERK